MPLDLFDDFCCVSDHIHFRNSRLAVGRLVPHPCPVKKIVYTSQDVEVPAAVVIFQGRHSHPPWPEEKANHNAKVDLDNCLEQYGVLDATGGRINNGMARCQYEPRKC